MRLLLHQAWTDLRHIRWPLAFWLALLGATTVPLGLRLDALLGDHATAERLLAANTVLLFVLALLSWLLAARMVHADPLDGSAAFWLTRPIGADRLFAAKLGSIVALFVLVPAAARALAAAGNGLSGSTLVRFFFEAALVELVFVLAVVLLATLTRDIARLVLAAIVVSAGWLGVHGLIIFSTLESRPNLEGALTRYSGLLAGTLIFCLGALLIIRERYRTRRPARSIGLIVLLLVAALAVTMVWPWNLLRLSPRLDAHHFDPSRVSLSLADARTRRPAARPRWLTPASRWPAYRQARWWSR